MIRFSVAAVAAVFFTALGPPPGHAAPPVPFFSIDKASPSVGLVSPADILAPGPVGGPPVVAVSLFALGLTIDDELDALAFVPSFYGSDPHFSVDRLSVGLPGGPLPPDVSTEAAAGQAAGDVFSTSFASPGINTLAINQDALGLIPPTFPGVVTPAGTAIDNVDALEYAPAGFIPLPGVTVFSLAAGSPTLTAIVAGPQDILVWTGTGPPAVLMPGAALGLVPGDDLDALAFVAGGPFFSLAPGSPSLVLAGVSAADMLAPGLSVAVPAGALGLAAADNMDALTAAIPEPETYAMMLAGLLAMGWLIRRRKG